MTRGANVPEEDRRRVADIERIEQTYSAIAVEIVKLALESKRPEAIEKMNADCRPNLARLVQATNDYADYLRTLADAQVAAGEAAYQTQRSVLITACIAAFAAAGTAGFLIARSLARSLGAEPAELGASARRVANGELSQIADAVEAPAGSVLASLGVMQSNLSRIVGQGAGHQSRSRQLRLKSPSAMQT